jgi:antitoxin ParD1/3/4
MNMNVSLPDELDDFVNAKISSGHYASASDVICEALRMMEQTEEARLAFLREAWRDGEAGTARPVDLAGIKARGRERLKTLRK